MFFVCLNFPTVGWLKELFYIWVYYRENSNLNYIRLIKSPTHLQRHIWWIGSSSIAHHFAGNLPAKLHLMGFPKRSITSISLRFGSTPVENLNAQSSEILAGLIMSRNGTSSTVVTSGSQLILQHKTYSITDQMKRISFIIYMLKRFLGNVWVYGYYLLLLVLSLGSLWPQNEIKTGYTYENKVYLS